MWRKLTSGHISIDFARLTSAMVAIADVPAPFVVASGKLKPSVIPLFWFRENGKSA
jgi:hypothetical protein